VALKMRETVAPSTASPASRWRWQPISPRAMLAMVAAVAMAFAAGWLLAPRGHSTVATPAPSAALPGPTRLEAGVPVGYPHTQAGAVSAAANFIEQTGGQAGRNLANRSALVAALASTEGRAKVTALLEGNDAMATRLFGSPAADFTAIATPVEERVVSYTPSSAVVDTWVVLTFTRPGLPLASAFWGGLHTTLTWAGDWKVADSTATAAPIPSSQQAVGDPNDLLRGFTADHLYTGAKP
jgi:hypothetical protein